MAESRLQRWSRKKARAGKDTAPDIPPAVEPEVEAAAASEEQALAVNETLPERELLEKYGLPDPDAIELGTDITGFMRKEIPEFLRRRALRSLWKSNPVLAVLDGLNDYDEDFTNAASAGNAVQTLYKVGQGFDRTPAVEDSVAEPPKAQAGSSDTNMPAGRGEPEPEVAPPEEVTAEPAPGIAVGPSTTRYVEAAAEGAETQPAPRYRPRMRFDS